MKVLKILDNSLPDVEQVIEVPKIILHQVPQRAVPREPQLAEQLVDVPVPSFHQCTRRPTSATTVAAGGACSRSLSLGGSRGGLWGPNTSRRTPRRGSPPAQGGIQILGMVEDLSTAPCIWQSLVLLRSTRIRDFLRDDFVCFRIHRIAWFAVDTCIASVTEAV